MWMVLASGSLSVSRVVGPRLENRETWGTLVVDGARASGVTPVLSFSGKKCDNRGNAATAGNLLIFTQLRDLRASLKV